MISKNPKLNKIILSIIVLFLALGVLLFSQKSSCTGLSCISFNESGSFKTQEIYQSDENSFRGLFTNGKEKIRIDVKSGIKQKSASEEISIMITKMKKLYEKERSPYPGEISDTVSCDEKYIPKWNSKETNGIEVNYTTAFLNDRMVYGACTEEQLTSKSLFVAFYCPKQQKLYQMEIINDKNKFSENQGRYMDILASLKCN